MLIGGSELPEGAVDRLRGAAGPAQGERVEPVDVELDDLQRLMYTSGTTSRPKGVRITYGNLEAKNLAHIVHFGLTAADTTLVCGPLYHVGGLDMPRSWCACTRRGSVVLQRKFDPQGVLGRDREATGSPMCGWRLAMVNAVLEVPDREEYDTSSVRFILGGGEKTPEPVLRRIMTAFPNAWFADAYGLTEDRLRRHLPRPRSTRCPSWARSGVPCRRRGCGSSTTRASRSRP
ncbi:AMP-binding protein [Streptomyces sp. L7]